MNNFSTAVYIYILRVLYIILKKNANKRLTKNFQVDEEIVGSAPYRKMPKEDIFKDLFKNLKQLCKSNEEIVFTAESTLILKNLKPITKKSLHTFSTKGYETKDLEGEVISSLTKRKTKIRQLPSLFVIDEARGLFFKKPGDEKIDWKFRDSYEPKDQINRAPYNVFRRAFRLFDCLWEHLMLIIISTCGQVSLLLPELDTDPSRRDSLSLDFLKPFVFVQTYNVNSEFASKIRDDMFPIKNGKKEIKNWREFLFSDFRKEEFFKFGRPLIYGTFVLGSKK